MPKPEFKRVVSRQREWQIKKLAEGRCVTCGRKAAKRKDGKNSQWCRTHLLWFRKYIREYQRKRRAA